MGSLLSKPLTSKNVESLITTKLQCGSAEMHGYRIAMEDAHVLTPMPQARHALLAGIFDGHNGADCSAYVAKKLQSVLLEEPKLPIDDEIMVDIVMNADKDYFMSGGEAGSTGVFAIFYPDEGEKSNNIDGKAGEIVANNLRVKTVNVGDSRAILWKSKDDACISVTADHKPSNLSERNRIEASGGHVSAGRVNGDLAVSRAFGDFQFKNNRELPMEEQAVTTVPDIFDHAFEEGDIFILACDGVFESNFSNEEVATFVAKNLKASKDPSWTACRLVDEALHRGSKDNISCTIIWNKSNNDEHEEPKAITGRFSIPGSYLPLVGNGNPGYREGFEKMCIRGGVTPSMMIERRYAMLKAAAGHSEADPSWESLWEVVKDTCSPESGFEELDAISDAVEGLDEQQRAEYFSAFWEKGGLM
ncbi:phosphatase 2C [Perkinsela sp. CCAP 1560/4]|nr:phosphatase 2C [Perkinsela sp. CCAP 1560/4]|eukprot:KNH04955.1 phosphatase 2C [Perkinsela sp. CCAP 1560/4]